MTSAGPPRQCPNGHTLFELSRFCPHCGSALTEEPPELGTAGHAPAGPPQSGAPTFNPPPYATFLGAEQDPAGPLPAPGWPGSHMPPPPPRRFGASRIPGWVWAVAAGVVLIVVVVSLVVRHETTVRRWSALPHTMGCHTVQADQGARHDPNVPILPVPDALRVRQTSLTHPGGERLGLTLEFVKFKPQVPRTYDSPITHRIEDMPGTFNYDIIVSTGHGDGARGLVITSPTRGSDWAVDSSDTSSRSESSHNALLSADVSGSVVTLLLDLHGQDKLFRDSVFKPYISVLLGRAGVAGSARPAIEFDIQDCMWDDPIADQSDQRPEAPSQAPTEVPPVQPSVPAPSYRPLLPPGPGELPPLPDADGHGFLDYPEARCLDVDPAVALGRTADSLVLICRVRPREWYYRGYGLKNHLPLFINGAQRTAKGFRATNNGVQYDVAPTL